MRTLRRPLVGCLVALLVAAGCTHTEDRRTDNAARNADQAIADVTERLASAGIAVYADPGDAQPKTPPAKPVSPMRLLEWQVRAMALEATRHGGITALDLNAHLPGVSAGSAKLAPSEVIAGWVKYGDSPAAEYARDVLGDRIQNPDTATFPQLVMVLFTSDLAVAGKAIAESTGPKPPRPSEATPTTPTALPETSHPAPGSQPHPPTSPPTGTPHPAPSTNESPTPAEAPATAPAVAPVALAVASQNGPCSTVVDFVDRVTAAVFNAIGHLPELPQITGGGFLGRLINTIGKVLVGGANVVIDGAHFVVRNVGRVAIATVLTPVAKIAGIVGTIAQITSAVRPWTVVMSADPRTNRKAIGTEAPLPGTVTARVDLGGLDEWPPFLTDCAQAAGVTLPPLKPAGNPVNWSLTETTAGLVNVGDKQPTLAADCGTTATYHTTVEPKYRNATDHVGHLVATATIQRDDVTKLQEALTTLLRDGLTSLLPPVGDIVAPLVLPFVQQTIAKAFEVLTHLRDVGNTIAVPISYHTGDEEEPESGEPTSSTPPEAALGKIPKTCPPLADITAAAHAEFDTTDEGSSYAPLALLGISRYGCDYELAAKRKPDDGLNYGGMHIVIGYDVPDRKEGIVAALKQYHGGRCEDMSVQGATAACIGADAALPATHYVVVSTDRTVAAASVSANFLAGASPDPAPPWAGRSREIATELAGVIAVQLDSLR